MADLTSEQIEKITELIKIQTKDLQAKVDSLDGLIALGKKNDGDIVEGLTNLVSTRIDGAAKQGTL